MAADDLVKGMVIGGLIGAALGILYAPKSGRETREEISRSADELLEKAKEQYEQARMQVDKLAGRGKDTYVEKKERLKKAVEAGVDAFKEGPAGAPQA